MKGNELMLSLSSSGFERTQPLLMWALCCFSLITVSLQSLKKKFSSNIGKKKKKFFKKHAFSLNWHFVYDIMPDDLTFCPVSAQIGSSFT